MRADRGQGTVEWIGLVLLLAGAIGAGAVLAQAPFAAHAVTRQLTRALCLARGGDCERSRQPCTVGGSARSRGLTMRLGVVELGADTTALIEQRSDGTTLLTVVDGNLGSVMASAGIGIEVAAGRHAVGLHLGLDASAAAAAIGGRSWLVRSPAEAEQILRAVGARRPRPGGRLRPPRRRAATPLEPLRAPDVTYREWRTTFAIAAKGSAGDDRGFGTPLELGGGYTTKNVNGVRVDHRSGERTVYLSGFRDYDGSVSVFGAGPGGTHRSGTDERYAVIHDAAGRPISLQVSATTTGVPAVAASFGGMLRSSGRGAPKAYETVANLDLTDPVHREATAAMLAAIAHARTGPLPAEVRQLAELVRRRGTVEVRGLATGEDNRDYGLSGTLGIRVGAHLRSGETATRLVTAASRGLDGAWVPRDDCVDRPYATGEQALQAPGHG